jgi:putative drug exporter of the RND superfamily
VASLLYRLGRISYRRRWRVLLLMVAVLGLLGVGAATLSGPTTNAFNIPGTESTRALAVLKEKMGVGADNAGATVVFTVHGTAKLTDPSPRAAIERAVAAVAKAPQVTGASDPFRTKTISQDGQTAYASISYGVADGDVTDNARTALLSAGRSAQSAGVEVEFGGSATQAGGGAGATEGIGIVVAAVVLMITFGALVAAGLPLLTAVLGVVAGMAGIQIATGFFDLSASTSALATMLGLAVGIDYALFVVSRFRHELQRGSDGEEAAGRAVATAGSAVVFAGLTVIIALVALSVTGIPFLTAMGVAAAGTVLMAVLITLTLIPALLGFAGRKVLPRRSRKPAAVAAAAPVMFGERWARLVLKNRIVAVLIPLGLILAAAVPALHLHLALPDDSTAAPASTQRKAYDQLSEGFGAGFNGPLLVVVSAAPGGAPAAASAARTSIAALHDVVVVTAPTVNPVGDTALLTVIPGSGSTSAATKDLVAAIRALPGHAGLAVTGTTAVNIDVSDKMAHALIPYLAIVVGLAFLLLMLVFRSVLVPLKATLGFLLSVVAAFGALVAVFEDGHLARLLGVEATGPIVSIMPIFLIGILFGLAMDYEVFLVTRTREEYVAGATPDEAVVTGLRHGARVVTAAALIMISVFAGFILADDSIIKSLGFALAFGVAVDAFLVRMTMVPAILSLLGRSAWWLPSWLDRLLPHVDVEGSSPTETPGLPSAPSSPSSADGELPNAA